MRSPRSLVFPKTLARMAKASSISAAIPMMSQRCGSSRKFSMVGRAGKLWAFAGRRHGELGQVHLGVGAFGLLRGEHLGNEVNAVELAIEGASGRDAGVRMELLHREG